MHLHSDVELKQVEKVAKDFVGEISQRPPVKSAVKREVRKRTVYFLDVLEMQNKDVLFNTEVEAGTYIRKLCHDMGEKLGVGAHMSELRRTKAGPFTEKTSVTMHELSEAWNLFKESGDETLLRKVILPIEVVVADLPKIHVKDSAIDSVCNGSRLGVSGVSTLDEKIKEGDLVAVMSLKGELISLGTALMNGELIVEAWEGDAATTNRVIMEKGTYPKIWGRKNANKRHK